MGYSRVFVLFCVITTFLGCGEAATNEDIEARQFVSEASTRLVDLINAIAANTFETQGDEDDVFDKFIMVRKLSKDLIKLSQQAREFDWEKVQDAEIRDAIRFFIEVPRLVVLGDEYFDSVIINLSALENLSKDKDIEPYLFGKNQPDQDPSAIAYSPDVENILRTSRDPDELQYYWETWRSLNSNWALQNLATFIDSIHKTVDTMGINLFEYWHNTNKTFTLIEMESIMEELRPAYMELHAFVREELRKKYGDNIDPTGPIPAHLFEQVIAQAWQEDSIIESYFPKKELPPYDSFVEHFDSKEMLFQAANFYKSLGFGDLNEDFLKNRVGPSTDGNSSSCSADVFDMTPTVYMLYCSKVDFRKFLQNHRSMARIYFAEEKKNLPIYYFNSYDLESPLGESVILSASTPKHLKRIGLAKDFEFNEKTLMNRLMRMGIHTMLNIPLYFVHTKVMNDWLNETTKFETINKYYWDLMDKWAGVEPPRSRNEDSIDFPYKFYLNLENNYQVSKFNSEILGYQMYKSFCKRANDEGALHNCDFYGNKVIGDDIKAMMSLGSSKPLREVLSKVMPNKSQLSAEPLLEYYKPLIDWLKAKNKESKVKIGWHPSKKEVPVRNMIDMEY